MCINGRSCGCKRKANVHSHSIVRASKSIGVVHKVCSTFEDELHHKSQLPIKLHLMGNILKSSLSS